MGAGVLHEGGVEVRLAGPVYGGLGKTGWCGWLVACGGSKVAWR